MTQASGVDDQILSLPAGGGAVTALGSTFETDLNTGTGGYQIPLSLPAGPNGISPAIGLRYHSAADNGAFGMGWTLGLLAIARQTDGHLPTYAAGDDRFVLVGDQELVDLGDGTFRSRVDTLSWRIRRQGDGWELTDTRGTRYLLGTSPAGRVETVEDGLAKTATWLLEQFADTNGNAVTFAYDQDGPQRYLAAVSWGTYQLAFDYETRPDPMRDGSFGFLLETRRRCNRIELTVTSETPPLVRSWTLAYAQAPGTGLSLLAAVTLAGHAADGSTIAAPPLTLGYTSSRARTLQRIEGPWPGAVPGSFASGALELLDWDGDGLPDVLDLSAGRLRVWPNRGRHRFGAPRQLAGGPALAAFDAPGVAFADMDGNGTADLIVLDRPLGGYYPHLPGGGFGRPVHWDQAPAALLAAGDARLVDLDGDGVIDLLVTGSDYFRLYYRLPGGGWSRRPATIPAAEAPRASLLDPHVFLADMTGDGLQDLVRVDGGGVEHWQYLGNGRWAPPLRMANAPALPRGFDPGRLFLTDVDGDGCADLVYVGEAGVSYWFNQGGAAWSAETIVGFTPNAQPSQIRLADLNGTGTAGVLWSAVVAGSRTAWFFLDLLGAAKPYLLSSIDNGIGLRTAIDYRPSTEFALDDAAAGLPWRTFHPFPTQCVSQVTASDAVTGNAKVTRFHYHEAHYDGVARIFAGFAAVDVEAVGDATIPTMRTHNVYHVGLDPAAPARPLEAAERRRLGALAGRLLRSEVYGLDGSPQAGKPYAIVAHDYDVQVTTAANGATVYVPRPTRTLEERWERGDAAFASRETTYLDVDAHGNVLRQRMRAWRAGVAAPDQDVTTVATFAVDESAHIVALPARITQLAADGTVLSAAVTLYDGPPHQGLPEGQVVAGNVTRREALALTDALAASIYGASPPDWPALGYFRHPGEDGTWVVKASYERLQSAAATALITRGARGFDTRLDYDATRQFPSRLTDAAGNVTAGTPDRRAMQMATLTDPNGQTTAETFDALGRVIATVKPNDTAALPTVLLAYSTAPLPMSATVSSRVTSGAAATLDRRQWFDGEGNRIAQLVPGEGDAGRQVIVQRARTCNARGLVSAAYEPYYAASAAYAPPPAQGRRTTSAYDGLGRLVAQSAPSGATVIKTFQPGSVEIANRPQAPGATPKRIVHHLDALQRVIRVEAQAGDQTVGSTYTYDAQNRLVAAVDPGGARTTMAYDLLGNLLAQTTVDTGRVVNTVDAAGNLRTRTAASGRVVRYEVDQLDRLVSVSQDGAASPDIQYRFMDGGGAAPPDGWQNRRGRLYQIQDGLGTLDYAYDAAARVTRSTRMVAPLAGRSFVTDVVYDALGRTVRTTLPEAAPGQGRRIVDYRYNARGLAAGSPGHVQGVDYDVDGNVVRIAFQNGVEERTAFDPLTGRAQRQQVLGPGGAALRDQTFTFDETGNLAAVASPRADEAGAFAYDALDRLTAATYGSGEHFAYTYGDGGNVTSILGLGELAYGGAAGSGAVTAAGGGTYAYDADGRLQSAPWGKLRFDALDRLVHADTAGGTAIDYAYDFGGRRVGKSVGGEAAQIVADTYVEIDGATAILWVPFAGRRILALAGGAGVFVHTDLLGTPTLYTALDGSEARRVGFGPYGTVRFDTAAGAALAGGTGYGGHLADAETGLVAMGRRYYDPRLGRFISPDQLVPGIFQLDGWNRYVYAHDNPLRYCDPTGLSSNALAVTLTGILVGLALSVLTLGAAAALGTALGFALSDATVATVTIGMVSNAALGGLAADRAGGDVMLGMVFGALIGGATALLGGAVAANVLGALGTTTAGYIIGGVGNAEIAGAGSGVAIGFAGGKGSVQSIYRHLVHGMAWGLASGVVFGYLASETADEHNLQLLTLKKLDPQQGSLLNVVDHEFSWGEDAASTVVQGNPLNLLPDVVDTSSQPPTLIWDSGQLFKGAVINIPVGWVPGVLMSYGGIAGLEAFSIALDDFGVFSYQNQIAMGIGLIPIVGWLPALFDAGKFGFWQKFNNGIYDAFSMGDQPFDPS